jgi:hypothetical protein
MANVVHSSYWAVDLCGGQCGFGHVNGQFELSLVDSRTGDMVSVIVRDQYRVDVANIPPGPGQSLLGALAGYPRIDQQFHSAGFDVDAISVTSGLERNNLHIRYSIDLERNTKGLRSYSQAFRFPRPSFERQYDNAKGDAFFSIYLILGAQDYFVGKNAFFSI